MWLIPADVYMMKQTYSKHQTDLRAHGVHVYIEYVCFVFASSCKRGIKLVTWTVWTERDVQKSAQHGRTAKNGSTSAEITGRYAAFFDADETLRESRVDCRLGFFFFLSLIIFSAEIIPFRLNFVTAWLVAWNKLTSVSLFKCIDFPLSYFAIVLFSAA